MARIDFGRLKRLVPLDDVRNSYQTPVELYQELDSIFNFTVDACANSKNALHPNYWTLKEDARLQSWVGHSVFCNPPYSHVKDFVELGLVASSAVYLLPVRTRTVYWQEVIFKKADSILFLNKSPKFVCPIEGEQPKAPFDVAIVVFKKGSEGRPKILSGDVGELRKLYQSPTDSFAPTCALKLVEPVAPREEYQTLIDTFSSKENLFRFTENSGANMETLKGYLSNLSVIAGELEQEQRKASIARVREQLHVLRKELTLNGVNKGDVDRVMLGLSIKGT